MTRELQITVLVDDTARRSNVVAAHGLALWIEIGDQHVLFDTGPDGETLRHNARALGVDLSTTDAIVLSHGHGDHSGGLSHVLSVADHPYVYLHPTAFTPKFHRGVDGSIHDVTMPPNCDHRFYLTASRIVWTGKPKMVMPNIHVTGPVPRMVKAARPDNGFFRDPACTEPDPLIDDQAVFFDSTEGLVVLLGCAHAGVTNTLRYVCRFTDRRSVYAVIGGMHLIGASEQRLRSTVAALNDFDVQMIAPCHCTGPDGAAFLWSHFTRSWKDCEVGSRFNFHQPEREPDEPSPEARYCGMSEDGCGVQQASPDWVKSLSPLFAMN